MRGFYGGCKANTSILVAGLANRPDLGTYSIMSTSKLDTTRLEAVFQLLRSLQPDINLSLAVTLLAVAREPGLSVNEIAERVDAPQQTVSRYVATLQGRYEMPGNESFARHPLLALEVSAQGPTATSRFPDLARHEARLSNFGRGG